MSTRYLIRVDGGSWSKRIRRRTVIRRARRWTRKRGAEPGSKLVVRSVADRLPLAELPEAADFWPTTIQRIYREVYGGFPGADFWGVYNRRLIAGTSSWSQHSWARAIDIGVSGDSDLGNRIAAFLQSRPYDRSIRILWRVHAHFDHLHVEMVPACSGTPPSFPQNAEECR